MVELTENKRLDQSDADAFWFDGFLKRLRDGLVTEADYNCIWVQCFRYSMGDREWRRRGFDEDDVIRLFCTNREVNTDNNIRLELLGSKVAKIDAENSLAGARRLHPERFQGMRNIFHLSVDFLVYLTSNLCVGNTRH